VNPSRILSNLTGSLTASEKLTEEDVKKLDEVAAAGKQKRFIMPPWRKFFFFFSTKSRLIEVCSSG
jgi:hypothetical protein